MSQSVRKHTHISVFAYLEGEKSGTTRHEFVNGVIYAMAGASARHNVIRNNMWSRLDQHIAAPCIAFSGEVKLRSADNADERYYYPDVFVSCDPNDDDECVRETAVLVIEVLSSTTERIDRTEKFEAYRRIPTVLEYGLLSQDAMELELFRRRTGWRREFFQRDDTVTLESVGLTLNVSQLYRRVVFEDPSLDPSITGLK